MATRLSQTWVHQLGSRMRRSYIASSIAYDEPSFLPATEPGNQHLSQNADELGRYRLFEDNSKLADVVKTGHMEDARKMFDEMSHRDAVSWTTMISGYVKAWDSSEALSLFPRMWVELNLGMDSFLLSVALKACALNSNVQYGELIHGYAVKTGLINSVFVGSAVLDMYTKIGRVWEGCKVFEEMPLRNVVTWTAIITGLVRAGCNREGLRYFSDMLRAGERYDSYTFAIALKACAETCALDHGKEIHTQSIKKGFDTSSFVANTLATMYNKCRKLEYGLRLFERMETKDVVSWTTIITNSVQMGQDYNAIEAFLKMRRSEVSANEFTFAAVMSACANTAKLVWGEQLHANVLLVGLADSLSVANSLMTLYSRCGRLDSAAVVFNEMTRRDVISWSTIIAGYAQGGCGEEAFKFLSQMRKDGPKPTEFALASVLSVSGNMASLEQGKQLHGHVLSIGLEHTAMIRSGLINMYAKCGSLEEAFRVFKEAEFDDIVSWTAMINGYAEHGRSKEAIDLFERISEVGLKPDSVTFIGVLTACCHAGLVDLGFKYFDSMSQEYGINPTKEHHGCMVDLLCRAGRLSEAEDMIRTMPYSKDDIVWSTLLRACREQGDVVRARRAADQILKLDPNCAGTHITLCNVYAAGGHWREAADVRKQMKSRGVMKEPGWSWIKVKEEGFAFVSGDRSHPDGDFMYAILDLVASEDEVYSEETDLLVHD